jgi:phospholipid/cholesterol/gamma-HCH transport system substrate-binding protein
VRQQAPTLGRVLVAIGFALSCFGLMLFLWVAFGGPLPLKPESYRITAYFPETTTLSIQSNVRIGGVTVGYVKDLELAPPDERVGGSDTTAAVLEIAPEFAPISSDARAILRQSTLVGETYVELTSGTRTGAQEAPVALGAEAAVSDSEARTAESIPEGGTLGVGQTRNATQIDEIFNALDRRTRQAARRFLSHSAVAIDGRGADLNDSFGNLDPFVGDAASILSVLRHQKVALMGLVRDTGTVFNALSERNRELAGAVSRSDQTFAALAREDRALADTFQVAPVFERESRLTLARLESFRTGAQPLVRKLLPVAHDVSPTLRSVRELSPRLESLFTHLTPLIDASRAGLPAASELLTGLRPVLDALDPFLANLNPVIRWLAYYRTTVTDFVANPPVALGDSLVLTTNKPGLPAPLHALRQLGYFSQESLAIYAERAETNRGNGYLPPNFFGDPRLFRFSIFPNFDCDNTGAPGNGEVNNNPPQVGVANCFVVGDFPAQFGGGRAPDLYADP